MSTRAAFFVGTNQFDRGVDYTRMLLSWLGVPPPGAEVSIPGE